MSNVLSLLPTSGWQRLLCDGLWQSTIVGLVGLLFVRFVVRQSAARAWVLLLALSVCLLVPLASAAARSAGWTLWRAVPAETERPKFETAKSDRTIDSSPISDVRIDETGIADKVNSASVVAAKSQNAADSNDAVSPNSQSTPVEPEQTIRSRPLETPIASIASEIDSPVKSPIERSAVGASPMLSSGKGAEASSVSLSQALRFLGIAWLAVSTFLFARLLLSLAATRRLLKTATLCDNATLLAAAVEAGRRAGVAKTPRLLVSEKVSTPMVFALGSPCLLIPSASICGGSSDTKHDWVAAFTHEMAHVARGDGWSRLAVEFILIVLPLQPLIWLLRREFYTACEEACDDWTVSTGVNPLDLADTLANWNNARRPVAMLAAIGMSSNKARILRLLSMQKAPRAGINRISLWTGITACFALGAALAMAQTKSAANKDEQPVAPTAENRETKTNETPFANDPLIQHYNQRLRDLAAQVSREMLINNDENYSELKELTEKEINDLNNQIQKRTAELRAKQGQSKPADSKGDKPLSKTGSAKSNVSDNSEIEKRFQDDSLISLYSEQRAAAASQLKELPSTPGATNELGEDAKSLTARMNDLANRIEKRKAEIRPRIEEELAAAAASDDAAAASTKAARAGLGPYIIEPPDIVLIEPIQLSPKKPQRVMPLDKVRISVEGTKFNQPISGIYQVDSGGEVVLGPGYGAVKISGLTRREAEIAVRARLEEVLSNPEVALILDESRYEKPIAGQHLVGPDGTINLGTFGQVYVAGMTIAKAMRAIEEHLTNDFIRPQISLDVSAYNSKVYYVITQGAGFGDNIQRFLITGNETVLDAISQVQGLSGVSKEKIFIARPTPGGSDEVIELSWSKLTSGSKKDNPQILPGDRLFVSGATLKAPTVQPASPTNSIQSERVPNRYYSPPSVSPESDRKSDY